ncbi:hypothetical protein PAMA_020263 [Pampus argenteus]
MERTVDLEGRQSWTDLVSHTFSTQEVSSKSSANGSPDHRGNNSLSASCSLLESDHSVVKLKNSFVHVGHNYNEFVEAAGRCLQEPERVSVIPGDAPLDLSPLASTQLHKAGSVSASPYSNEDCSDVNFPFPLAGIKGQCDQVFHPGQTADGNCEYVKTDFKKPSNGYVILGPEDACLTPNLNSSPALTVTETEPDSSRRVQDLPRIVKHKLSSITFSDYSDHHAFINESSDDGESSQEEGEDDDNGDGDGDDGDDDEDDDVFPEMPPSRDVLVNNRHKRNGKDDPKSRGAMSARAEIDPTGSNCGEAEASIKEHHNLEGRYSREGKLPPAMTRGDSSGLGGQQGIGQI